MTAWYYTIHTICPQLCFQQMLRFEFKHKMKKKKKINPFFKRFQISYKAINTLIPHIKKKQKQMGRDYALFEVRLEGKSFTY